MCLIGSWLAPEGAWARTKGAAMNNRAAKQYVRCMWGSPESGACFPTLRRQKNVLQQRGFLPLENFKEGRRIRSSTQWTNSIPIAPSQPDNAASTSGNVLAVQYTAFGNFFFVAA